MEMNMRTGQVKLALIVGISIAIFAATSAVATVGYPAWMWALIVAGLVLPPIGIIISVAVAVASRLSRT
jgi:amino acid transporter